MKEDILHFLWKNKLFATKPLFTERGEFLQIIHPGSSNKDSGPDFFNARIKINEILWVGNVEIHVRSSDWLIHQHHRNKTFDNTILHVVYEYDQDVSSVDGSYQIPVLSLKRYIDPGLLERYRFLQHTEKPAPCHSLIGKIDSLTIYQ